MKNVMIPCLVIVTVFVFTVLPDTGFAMPGFARRHRMSCQVCHAPFPRLKPYGEDFAAQGFRLPDTETPQVYRDVGDDMLLLIKEIPIGLRMDLYATHEPDADPSDRDLKTPYIFKVISGSPISRNISYYFYFFFSERGEVAGVEDAFLYFYNIFNTGVNVTAGQFAVSDPLFKNELRLTYEPYQIFGKHPSRSHADLKYDRGLVIDYGFDFGLDLSAQLVNGNGIREADGTTRSYDEDDYKNYMLRASQAVGPVRVGGFYYAGLEENTADDISENMELNRMDYYGGDVTIGIDPVEINALYLARSDTNPHFLEDGDDSFSAGYMVEVIFQPGGDASRWVVTGLYNSFESDYEENSVEVLDYRTGTLGFSYLAARNVRLVAEYTYIWKDLSRAEDFENRSRYLIGVVAGF